VVFGLLVAVTSTLLMAPQTTEFGAKVGLLSGLVIVCAARPLIERWLPAPKSDEDRLRVFVARLASLGRPAAAGMGRRLAAAGLAGVLVLGIGGGIVLAGSPARGPVAFGASEILARVPTQVDPATLPPITVGQDVVDFDPQLAGAGMQAVVVTLAQNLELENAALLRRDATILQAVDHGDRLAEMQARLADATAGGSTVVVHYQFDSISVRLLIPFGVQDGFSLGIEGRGTAIRETYDAAGALQSRVTEPFAQTFAVRRATGDRWLNVAVLPPA
jgi:hypothetical protein